MILCILKGVPLSTFILRQVCVSSFADVGMSWSTDVVQSVLFSSCKIMLLLLEDLT